MKMSTIKFKHNKKKNTAFLYEVLVRLLTKSILDNNPVRQHDVKKVLKEFFRKGTALGKELKIYKDLCDLSGLDETTVLKVLKESKIEHAKLNNQTLIEEQARLVSKIKKAFGDETFHSFVPNYKYLASLSQIFNSEVSPKARVLLENDIVSSVSKEGKHSQKEYVPMDSLVVKSFLKIFNEKYSVLHNEQKKLLNEYVTSFSDSGVGLKVFLNEEIGRLKEEISKSLSVEEIKSSPELMSMTNDVMTLLERLKDREFIDEGYVGQVIKTQSLIREINS